MIIGLQGDEPATPAHHLDFLALNLSNVLEADMATLCMPITQVADFNSVHRVKVVRDYQGMALYFSRAPIPARRDSTTAGSAVQNEFPEAFLHIGLYAYRCGYLMKYPTLQACVIEQEEQLEQLRVLYNGGRIHVGAVEASSARGVDHPEDVPVLEALLSSFGGPVKL